MNLVRERRASIVAHRFMRRALEVSKLVGEVDRPALMFF